MRRWLWLLLALGLFVACSAPPTGLRVSPAEATLEPGEELVLTATGVDADDLIWTAEHGTLIPEGAQARYRAPDYAVDDRIEVVRGSNPRERVEVPVRVRGSGVLAPRIRVRSDLALVFTRPGETRELAVVVYDAAGRPDPEAAVRFGSDDPTRVAVEATGPQTARVRALAAEPGTVRLWIRAQDAETYAWAVMAELRSETVRLEDAWILSAAWDADALAWTGLVLERTPETEALRPGQVVFSGDRAGVWGRVEAVHDEGERLALDLAPAGLSDVFWNLDYRAELPPYPVTLAASSREGIQLARGADGGERLAAGAACPGLERGAGADGRIEARAFLVLRVVDGALEAARWDLDLAGELGDAGFTLDTAAAAAGCTLARLETRLPPLSWLLFSLRLGAEIDARSALDPDPAPARLVWSGERARFRARRTWDAAPGTSDGPQVAVPGLETEPEIGFAEPGRLRLRLDRRLRLIGEVRAQGTQLGEGTLAAQGDTLLLTAALAGPLDPADPDYRGPDWELAWTPGAADDPGDLEALLSSVAGLRAPASGGSETAPLRLAGPPRVWGHLDTGGVRRLDLGEAATEPAARFSFEADPPEAGRVEVWLRGGACEDPADCFSGLLERVAVTDEPDGPLAWRPEKDDRGVYEVFFRYRLGTVGARHPYAGRPPDPWLLVQSPDLQDLPLALELRGAPGGTAVGVLRYRNAALVGVFPNGKPVELTSTLQVWTPREGAVRAQPRKQALAAGLWGYQRLTADCPETAGRFPAALPLYTNDPELPDVVVPVDIVCEAGPRAVPWLEADRNGGAASLAVTFRMGVRAPPGARTACALDFGDGSPPRTWPRGCPARLAVHHVYERPGLYRAVLWATDADGGEDLAAVELRVD